MTGSLHWIAVVDALAAWLSTYLLHSTALLVPALLLARWQGGRRLALQESVLRVALVGGLLTASLQSGLGWEAATGSISIPSAAAALEAPPAAGSARALGLAAAEVPGAWSIEDSTRTDTQRSVVPRAAVGSASPRPRSAGAVGGGAIGSSASAGAPSGSAIAARANGILPWLALAVVVWLAGALLSIVHLGLLAVRLRATLRDRERVREGRVFRIFWRLLAAADIDRPTVLTRTDGVEVPIALGVGRREICLPRRVSDELPPEQQETVLAHELAHLERHDPAWLLAGRVIESVFFLQPLNRIARRRLQEVAEFRCDDWAAARTGRPLTLARCLTEVATWSQAKRSAALAPTMAGPSVKGRSSGLGRRVRRLLDPGYSSLDVRLPSWWRPLAAMALILVLVGVPGVSTAGLPGATQSEEASDDGEPRSDGSEPDSAGSSDAVAVVVDSGEDSESGAAPVVGSEGIVGPTEDYDASDPAVAPSPAIPSPVAPAQGGPAPGAPDSLGPVGIAPSPMAPGPDPQDDAAVPGPAPRAQRRAAPSVEPALAPVVRIGRTGGETAVVAPVIARGVTPERVVVTVAPRVAVRVAPRPIESRIVRRERSTIASSERAHHRESRLRGSEVQDSGRAGHDHSADSVDESSDTRDRDADDWDEDWDDDWEDELDAEMDALEDEIDAIVDELEDTFEGELEPMMESLEDELDRIEEMFETSIDGEMEGFEDSLESELEAFEDELDRLEDRFDSRFEGSDAEEERFEEELERIEDAVDRLYDRLDEQMDRIEGRVESRLERRWERDFEGQLERHFEAMEHRIDAEAERLESMAYQMMERAEDGRLRLSPDGRERLMAEARRIAEEARPSAEEMETLREELERARAGLAPDAEELEAMRMELRTELEELRAQAERGLAEQRRALDELRRKYGAE